MKRLFTMLTLLLIAMTADSFAQDSSIAATKEEVAEIQGALDGVNETLTEVKNTLDALKKIKISGYIQAQYQSADTAGMPSFAGGNFPGNVRSRFAVRRGRFKINYDNDLTQYVLQVDVTQGGVGIKDAYASIKDPWLRTFSLTAGVFDRPFGFEISYSSSSRETPERSRLFQTLFPGERELGAKIEIMPPEETPWTFLNLKAGLFNGVLNNANENDRNKDFIGRLGFQAPFDEQNLAIDGGVSLYSGKVMSNSKFVNSLDDASPIKKYKVDSLITNTENGYGRSYIGADVEIYYDIPVLGGMSVRGEYITGQQPGTSTSNSFYNPGSTITPLYIRKFSGWYINYIQNIGLTNQFVLKYDVLDPNCDVDADQIGIANSNLTAGDVKYSTLGIGWIYHWDANVKFTAYCDIVMNEKVNSSATGSLKPLIDDVKDNVFTLRMQYRF